MQCSLNVRINSHLLFLECKYKLKWTLHYLSDEDVLHFFHLKLYTLCIHMYMYTHSHLNYIIENIIPTKYSWFELIFLKHVYLRWTLVCQADKDGTVLYASTVSWNILIMCQEIKFYLFKGCIDTKCNT